MAFSAGLLGPLTGSALSATAVGPAGESSAVGLTGAESGVVTDPITALAYPTAAIVGASGPVAVRYTLTLPVFAHVAVDADTALAAAAVVAADLAVALRLAIGAVICCGIVTGGRGRFGHVVSGGDQRRAVGLTPNNHHQQAKEEELFAHAE